MSTKGKWMLAAVILGVVLLWPVSVPCEQCGETIHTESLVARMFADFESNFLHFECIDDFLLDNPLERDQNGDIIRKFNVKVEK